MNVILLIIKTGQIITFVIFLNLSSNIAKNVLRKIG